MQHDSISTQPKQGFWPRGGNVEIVEGQVRCSLDYGRQYDLAKWTHRYSVHAKFLQWKTEKQLIDFVRAWGPLDIVAGMSIQPLAAYRAFQRRLKALVNLLHSCGDGHLDGRECLLEYCAADQEAWDLGPIAALNIQGLRPESHIWLHDFSQGKSVSEWLAAAAQSQVRQAIARVFEHEFSGRIHLAVEHDGKQFQIVPRWDVQFFRDAMRWLIWMDRLGFCPECNQLFKVTSHRWKFCSDECARRATDREWRSDWRKNRQNRRKEENARKSRAAKKGRRK